MPEPQQPLRVRRDPERYLHILDSEFSGRETIRLGELAAAMGLDAGSTEMDVRFVFGATLGGSGKLDQREVNVEDLRSAVRGHHGRVVSQARDGYLELLPPKLSERIRDGE
jgi:hypothetical protein